MLKMFKGVTNFVTRVDFQNPQCDRHHGQFCRIPHALAYPGCRAAHHTMFLPVSQKPGRAAQGMHAGKWMCRYSICITHDVNRHQLVGVCNTTAPAFHTTICLSACLKGYA